MRKIRTLVGLCKSQETLQVINNTLDGVAWKITRFQVFGKSLSETGGQPIGLRLCTDMRGLNTQAALGTSAIELDSDQVIGATVINLAGNFELLDEENFVVRDLFIDNLTSFGCYYKIEMEMYKISPDEQIVYTIKSLGQDVDSTS